MNADFAAVDPMHSEQRLEQFAAPAAEQAGEADDLAPADRECDFANFGRCGREIADLQADRAASGRRGRSRRMDAPDHHLDHLAMVYRRRRHSRHASSVAHHGQRVRKLAHLVELVRYVENADAAGLQPFDQLIKPTLFGFAKRAGRFVEDEHLAVGGNRARNLDHLPDADA